jgi:hypothetical protein
MEWLQRTECGYSSVVGVLLCQGFEVSTALASYASGKAETLTERNGSHTLVDKVSKVDVASFLISY